ncbi:hypothetical protein ABPG72_002365 [Tetrahymena utriculariae]
MGKRFALFAILCLSLSMIGSVSCGQTTSAMLQALQLVQMQTGYVVDDILAFLKSFSTDINNQILHLDDAVKIETAYLEKLIEDLKVQKESKFAECGQDKDALDVVVKEYNQQLAFVNWITNKTNEDYERIAKYQKQSCSQTLDFIEYLRHAQTALNLIDFLRNALENYSFTQLKAITKVVKENTNDNTLFSTSSGLQLMLLQFQATIQQVDASKYSAGESLEDKISDRTQDEIGTGHIDNDQGDIDVSSYQSGSRLGLQAIKKELFAILDELEAVIKKNMNDKINDMINLAESISDYILQLKKEIDYLQKELVIQQQVLREIELRVEAAQQVVNQCLVDYNSIVKNIEDTQEKHDKYIKDRSYYREVLLDQLDQLAAIINIYQKQIATAGENYKRRYDDLLDNGTVDYTAKVDDRVLYTDYNDHQTPDLLEQIVEDDIVATAPNDKDDSINF